MEIEILLKKALKGNKKSFIHALNKIERDLYIIAKSKLNNEDDIKDCIQETVLLSYQNLKDLKDLSKFKSWVTKILINNCYKILNENKINLYSYEEIEAEKYLQAEDNFIEVTSDIDFFEMINFLSEEEKLILVMSILDDYSSIEISQILDINENTVRSKLMRAKSKIKQKYGKGLNYD